MLLGWSPEHYNNPKDEAWRLVGCNKLPEELEGPETIGVELGLGRRLGVGHGPLLILSVLEIVSFELL